MKHIFIKEYGEYDKSDILNKLDALDYEKDIFEDLVKYRIVVSENEKVKFSYVGLILIDNKYVLNCYPKYFSNEDNIRVKFKQVINVIKKYIDSKEKFNKEYLQIEKGILETNHFNLLSMMLFFIEDYYENGVYSNIQNILELNGNGEINWDKTINDTSAIIKNNKPYYTELHTRYKINNLYDYFRLLHEYIITECSINLENAGLLEYFDLMPIELSDKTLYDFGDEEFILNKLEKELNLEYNTHKRKLLETMHAYLSCKKTFSDENNFLLYGVYKYEHVWEEMCAKVFNNVLYNPLKDLIKYLDGDSKIRLSNLFNYIDDKESKFNWIEFIKLIDEDDSDVSFKNLKLYMDNFESINKWIDIIKNSENEVTLYDLIEKPNWVSKKFSKRADYSLKPDLITIFKDQFIIFDAKYYDLTFEEKELDNAPGIGDITKQYLYELVYNDFINFLGFKEVRNAFLMPSDDTKIVNKCYVELEMLSSLGLENIQVIMLPAKEINQLYLNNKTMDISRLNL